MSSTALNDADEWRDLSSSEQSDILQQGLQQELGDEPGVGDIPRWEDTDDVTQEQTLAAIEGALAETWTALLYEDDEDRQTVPFEVKELTEGQQDEMMEWMQVFGQLQQAEANSLDELREEVDDADELVEKLDGFDTWANQYLEDVTTGDAFDADWWAAAHYPGNARIELFKTIFERYNSQLMGAESFQ